MVVIKEVVANYVIHGSVQTMHARIIKSAGLAKSYKWEISHWCVGDDHKVTRPNNVEVETLEKAYKELSEYVKGYTCMSPNLNPYY